MSRWADLKAAVREMFATTWDHDDEPASIAEDTAARTAWIQRMKEARDD